MSEVPLYLTYVRQPGARSSIVCDVNGVKSFGRGVEGHWLLIGQGSSIVGDVKCLGFGNQGLGFGSEGLGFGGQIES